MPNVTTSGSFDSLEKWLKRVVKGDKAVAEQFAKELVDALKKNTPVRSGKTASSWGYNVSSSRDGWEIEIFNSNINNGVNIAVILHYGHGTGTGGYVPGTNYITKAIDDVYKSKIDSILTSMLK